MDIEIINILKKHGCLYMAEDYKELLTDIQEHYKQAHALQLLQPNVIKSVCDHPFTFVMTKCNGEINHCLKCGEYI